MKAENSHKILGAQQFITNHLKKTATKQINDFTWHQKEINMTVHLFRLTIYSGDKSSVFAFTKDELIEDYEAKKWEKRLNRRVKEILAEIEG